MFGRRGFLVDGPSVAVYAEGMLSEHQIIKWEQDAEPIEDGVGNRVNMKFGEQRFEGRNDRRYEVAAGNRNFLFVPGDTTIRELHFAEGNGEIEQSEIPAKDLLRAPFTVSAHDVTWEVTITSISVAEGVISCEWIAWRKGAVPWT